MPICQRHFEKISAGAAKALAGGKLPDPREFGQLAQKTIIPEYSAQIQQLRATTAAGSPCATACWPVPPVLDLLVPALRRIGIEVKPRAVDLPTLFSSLQKGLDDLALSLYPGPGGTAANADPDTLRTFYSSALKGSLQGAQGYGDAEFDRLAQRRLVTADRPEREWLVARMQQIVARDLPALALITGSKTGLIVRGSG